MDIKQENVGAYETPIVNEEDFIEITEEEFDKMVIERLMKEEVYSVAASQTLKNSKGNSKAKSVKKGTFFPPLKGGNVHNTEEIEIERGNNDLGSTVSDVDGGISENTEEQMEKGQSDKDDTNIETPVDEIVSDIKKRNETEDKKPTRKITQVGDNLAKIVKETKRYKLKDKVYLNEENINALLEKYESKMRGTTFIVSDYYDNEVEIDWSSSKAELLGTKNINRIHEMALLQDKLFNS